MLRGRVTAELLSLGCDIVDLGTNRSEPRIDYLDKGRLQPGLRRPHNAELGAGARE